jgi:hypothetical protein
MITNNICPICKSSYIYILTDIVRKCKQKDFIIMICDICHHMFPCKHFSYEEQKDISSHYISTKTVTSFDYNLDCLRSDNITKIEREEIVYDEIVSLLTGNVLIIGGGYGYQHRINSYFEIVDPSKFVKIDKKYKFFNCTFEAYLPTTTFDTVLLQDVLCYFVKPIDIFKKIYELLNVGGSVIVVGGHIIDEYGIDFNDKLIFQFMSAHYFSKQSIKLSMYLFDNTEFFNVGKIVPCVRGFKNE